MKKNRLNLILIIFLIAFFVLLFRLFQLTIVKGDTFREFSDNNRIKQIEEEASRGIIYDRNGNELAINKAIYNVDAYNDRFSEVETNKKNNILSNFVKIMEEEGVNYLSEYAFNMYSYIYKNKTDYFNTEILPTTKVVDIILKNNLLEEILNQSFEVSNGIKFYPLKRMSDYLIIRGKELPIKIEYENGVSVGFVKNAKYNELLREGKIKQNQNALNFVIDQVKDDTSFIKYMLSHPLSRKIVYDLLLKHNLQENIEITDLVYNFDIKFIEHKSILNNYSKKVTLNSDAKSDFLNLVKDNSIKTLLTNIYEDDKKQIVPISILLSELEKNNIATDIEYKIEDKKISINFKEGKEKDTSAIDHLINILNSHSKVLDNFLLDKNILRFAQQSLFQNNIYPRIYLKEWEYTEVKDKKDIFKNKKERDVETLFSEYKEKYELKNNNKYLNFAIMSIYDLINRQGFHSYRPVTIAKNLNKEALLKVETLIPTNIGLEVVVQPSRYYPHGTLAAHTLGYMGSISEAYEVEKYVDYKKYNPNDSVGKSGLEESFEDTLRGSKGKKLVFTDVFGYTTDVIEKTDSVPGNNLYTTIDLNLQKTMEDVLSEFAYSLKTGASYEGFLGRYNLPRNPGIKLGASVVMDVRTGEILAMASYPSYDPNLFVNGIREYDWEKINDTNEKDLYASRPILNNLFQAITPGSTFKTVVSLAALENGLDPLNPINNFGYVEIGDTRFNELIYTLYGGRWGNLNLYDALKVSSNYYFYVLGLGYNPNQAGDNDIKVSLEDIQSITKRLKMQEKTNIEINIPRESSGLYPNLEGKKSLIRGLLKNALDGEMQNYLKSDLKYSAEKLNEDLQTILSWVEKGPKMSRAEVEKELDKMGYDPFKRVKNRPPMADYIKYTFLNMAIWTQSDSVNMVIGQGQNAYTPLQMVRLASIFANSGKIVQPTVVKEIKDFSNTNTIFKNEVKVENSNIREELFKHVREGMRRSAMDAEKRRSLPFDIGGKTGSAQISSKDPDSGRERVSLSEMVFAPFDKPEIAVFTFFLGDGGTSAQASAANTEMVYAYFKYVKKDPRFTNKRGKNEDYNYYEKTKNETKQEEIKNSN